MSQFFVNSSAAPIPPTILETLTANDGSVGTAVANNINVLGNNTANNGFATYTNNAGAGVFHVNSYGPYKWIVNPIPGVGTHTTIAGALASASSGDAIFITPGTYTENLVPTVPVSLIASAQGVDNGLNQQTVIVGNISHTIAGQLSFNNIHFRTNGNYIYSMTGVNPCLGTFENCFFDMNNFSAIFVANTSASSSVNLFSCKDNINSSGSILFNCSFTSNIGGNLNIYDHDGYNSAFSNVPSVMVAGVLIMDACRFYHPITVGVSASCHLDDIEIDTTLNISSIATCLTISCNSAVADYCSFYSLTASAINITSTGILELNQGIVDSTNVSAITGVGQIRLSDISFTNTSSLVNTTTQIPNIVFNDAVEVVRPTSYPYTVIAQDAVISVDTSGAAPTITLPASPAQGQKHTVKDRSANAAASNITVSGGGHNIVGTTSAATQVISLNGAAVTYVFDQTLWLAC